MAKKESTEIALSGKELEQRQGAIELLISLEKEGKATDVGLNLTDPDLPYETWESLGRFLGSLDRRTRWYVGDWLNFGEDLYGQEAAQAVESTQRERYSEAERVTGLDHATLLNISSICRRVAFKRRRSELGFWVHAEVAALEPGEQIEWLKKAVDNSWTRSQLREAIRDEKNPPSEDDDLEPEGEGGDHLSLGERIQAAARAVLTTAQPTRDHNYLVPEEPIAQLRAAFGEE